jgi:hypothetical protein
MEKIGPSLFPFIFAVIEGKILPVSHGMKVCYKCRDAHIMDGHYNSFAVWKVRFASTEA